MIQGGYSGGTAGNTVRVTWGTVGAQSGFSRVSEWERSHSLIVSRSQIPRVFNRVDREQAVIIIIDGI